MPLIPDHEETFVLDGVSFQIPATRLSLERWTGTLFSFSFGGKSLVDVDEVPMLGVQRLSVGAHWSSR
jgi:hypothetical protein